MTTQIVKTLNPNGSGANNFTTVADAMAYVRGLDCIGTDTNFTFYDYIGVNWPDGTGPASSSTTQRVTWMAAPGLGTNDINKGAFNYFAGSGITMTWRRGQYGLGIPSGIDFINLNIQITESSAGSGAIKFYNHRDGSQFDNTVRYCRVIASNIANGGELLTIGNGNTTFRMEDTLFITERGDYNFHDMGGGQVMNRCTFVARGAGLGTSGVVRADYNATTLTDCVMIGYSVGLSNAKAVNCFANFAANGGVTAGVTINTTPGALVVDETSDFTPTANGPLIGTATATAIGTLDIIAGNRGPAPDVGARQRNASVPSPTASNVQVVVNGDTVTITGSTANVPASGTISLVPNAVANNNGVGQGPTAVTLTQNAFSCTFTGVKVGKYTPQITLVNTGGTTVVPNMTTLEVTDAVGTVVTQTLDGQTLTLSGTYTGTPDKMTVSLPAAATTPNGAVAQVANATFANGSFSVTIIVPPGNYDPALVCCVTSKGTSFPAAGTRAIKVLSISGNPQTQVISATASITVKF